MVGRVVETGRSYALCNDRRTLLWFANQRAIEYHPALVRVDRPDRITHLVLDLDPPEADAFAMAVRAAHAVRQALTDVGLTGAVKTSGAKGLHVFVPIDNKASFEDSAAATRAIAARAERLDPDIATTAFVKAERGGKVFVDATRVGGATVIAAYSPRVRPGVPVSFPVAWEDLDDITPADFTVHTALRQLGDRDPWLDAHARPAAPVTPSSSRRAMPSRSRGSKRCTRANAAPARLAAERPTDPSDGGTCLRRRLALCDRAECLELAFETAFVRAGGEQATRDGGDEAARPEHLRQPGAFRNRLESDVRLAFQDEIAKPGSDMVRPLDLEDLGRALHRPEPDGVARASRIDRPADIGHPCDAAHPLLHPVEVHPQREDLVWRGRNVDADPMFRHISVSVDGGSLLPRLSVCLGIGLVDC